MREIRTLPHGRPRRDVFRGIAGIRTKKQTRRIQCENAYRIRPFLCRNPHTTAAWFEKTVADQEKETKKRRRMCDVRKAPSERSSQRGQMRERAKRKRAQSPSSGSKKEKASRAPFAFGKTGKFWETEKMFHGSVAKFVFHMKSEEQKHGFSKFYTVSTEFSTGCSAKSSRETFGVPAKICGAVGFPFSENKCRKSHAFFAPGLCAVCI